MKAYKLEKGEIKVIAVNGKSGTFNHNMPWTADQEEYLLMYFGKMPDEQLAAELGRTVKAIREKYRVLTQPRQVLAVLDLVSVDAPKRHAIGRIVSIAIEADLDFEKSGGRIVISLPGGPE